MPEEHNKILKYNQGEKSKKVPFIIYADLECLLEKMNTCHKNCMKNFYLDLREHATKIINYEKKEMIPLTKKEEKKHKKQKVCYICQKVSVLMITIKNIIRLEIIVTILENVEVLLRISAT